MQNHLIEGREQDAQQPSDRLWNSDEPKFQDLGQTAATNSFSNKAFSSPQPLYRAIRQRLPQSRLEFVRANRDHGLLHWQQSQGLSLGESGEALFRRLTEAEGGLRLAFAPHRLLPTDRELLCMETEEEAKQTGLIPLRPTVDAPPPIMAWLSLGTIAYIDGDQKRLAPLVLAPIRMEGHVVKLAGKLHDLVVNGLMETIWQTRRPETVVDESEAWLGSQWKEWLRHGRFWEEAKQIDQTLGIKVDLDTCWIGNWDFEILEALGRLQSAVWSEESAPFPRATLPEEARREDWLLTPEEEHHGVARRKLLDGDHLQLFDAPELWASTVVNTSMTLAANGRSTLIVGDAETLDFWEKQFFDAGISNMVLHLSRQAEQPARLALHFSDAWTRPRPETDEAEATLSSWRWARNQRTRYFELLESPVGRSGISMREITARQAYLDRRVLPEIDPAAAADWTPEQWQQKLALLAELSAKSESAQPWQTHPFEESRLTDVSTERLQAVESAFRATVKALERTSEAGLALCQRIRQPLGANQTEGTKPREQVKVVAESAQLSAPQASENCGWDPAKYGVKELQRMLDRSHLLARVESSGLAKTQIAWNREVWQKASSALKAYVQCVHDLADLKNISGIDPDPTWKDQMESVRRGLLTSSPSLLRGLWGDRSNVDRQLQVYFPAMERGAATEQIRKVEAALAQIELSGQEKRLHEALAEWDEKFLTLTGEQARILLELTEAVSDGELAEVQVQKSLSGEWELHALDLALRTALEERTACLTKLESLMAFLPTANFQRRISELPILAQKRWLISRGQSMSALRQWGEWLAVGQRCREQNLAAFVDHLSRQTLLPSQMESVAQESYWLALARYAGQRPAMRSLDISEVNEAARELPTLVKNLVAAKAALAGVHVWNQLTEAPPEKLETLRALVLNPNAAPPVRDLLFLVGDALPLLRPIMLAEPKHIEEWLPTASRFDLCVVNPEKQSDVDLTPAVLRSRQVVAFLPPGTRGWGMLSDVERVCTVDRRHSATISGWTEFQQELSQQLQARGYQLKMQPHPGVDMGVVDPIDEGQILLGIQVDLSLIELDRVIAEPSFPVLRTWTLSWLKDWIGEWERILGTLDGELRRRHPQLPTETYMKAFPSLPFGAQSLSEIPAEALMVATAEVVSVEAPIHMATAARRLSEAAGLARLGARSLRALDQAFQEGEKAALFRRKGNFLYRSATEAETDFVPIRDRRGLPLAQRSAEWIAPEELAACVEAGGDPAVWLAADNVPAAYSVTSGVRN
jgi:hypothetical protein